MAFAIDVYKKPFESDDEEVSYQIRYREKHSEFQDGKKEYQLEIWLDLPTLVDLYTHLYVVFYRKHKDRGFQETCH